MALIDDVLKQLKETLNVLVPETLHEVFLERVPVISAPGFPYVYFQVSDDTSWDTQGVGSGLVRIGSGILIVIVARPADDYATAEVAKLIGAVRKQIMKDRTRFTNVTILRLRILRDPDIAALFGQFASGTLLFEYAGVESFS